MTNRAAGRESDMTAKEVAEVLRMHPETIRTMARSGDFPNACVQDRPCNAHHLRIPWADVEDYRRKQPRANR